MSRALISPRCSALLLSILVSACAISPGQAPVTPLPPAPIEARLISSPLQRWLELQAEVMAMTAEQAAAALASLSRPEAADQLFQFGLLHQASATYNGWMQARDVFRQLCQDEALSPQARQLAGLLEAYNQSRINAHQRYAQLQLRIDELELQKHLLEQKIQAITELEATMSIRKEQ